MLGRAAARFPLDDVAVKRLLDIAGATILLVLLAPVIAVTALAIALDSRGTIFFRCRRVGLRGREFQMLKFRKMRAGASGAALTVSADTRFTRVGRFLARSKLDEIPQLWNVLKGEMSFVGPRPEDPSFVALRRDDYATILTVKPGMTGLCQLAFAKESNILDPADPVGDYVRRLLPQKTALDRFYAERRRLGMDLRLLCWTAVAVLLRRDVAVHRGTGKLGRRVRPPTPHAATVAETRPEVHA